MVSPAPPVGAGSRSARRRPSPATATSGQPDLSDGASHRRDGQMIKLEQLGQTVGVLHGKGRNHR